MTKILITGAHFTPAVATVEELKKYSDVTVLYVGRKTTQEGDPTPSQESVLLPKLGVKFIPIITGRLQRSFTIYTIPSLLKIPIGFLQALYLILIEKPDVILSFGGYVAVPLVFAGWLLSIPIIVHEQTLVSGLANKISNFFADKIALSFKYDHRFNSQKVVVTGNPLRSMIREVREDFKIFNLSRKEKLPIILITGGNQGSHTINQVIEEILAKLLKIACVIHITGQNKFKDFERLGALVRSGKLGELEERYLVKKWIGEKYGAVLQKVDLVVSRAGANTLSELAFLGKPALVIPLQPLYEDEQNKNSQYFEKIGLVKILPQYKLTGKSLLKNIRLMLNDLQSLSRQAKNAQAVIIPDAAKRLALETILLRKNHKYS